MWLRDSNDIVIRQSKPFVCIELFFRNYYSITWKAFCQDFFWKSGKFISTDYSSFSTENNFVIRLVFQQYETSLFSFSMSEIFSNRCYPERYIL
ncbi:MAG: hypothetical protein K2K89_00005, partial [Ruminococcus sp.]|nr:hypothetical protein [Ruminococcus sp.]